MLYEVTITLKGPIRSKSTLAQWEEMYLFLDGLCRKYRMSLVAELHKDGCVHYHGLVDLKDLRVKTAFLNDVRRNKHVGRISCSQVMYEESYKEYMVKEVDVTTYILGLPPFIANFHNLTVDEFNLGDGTGGAPRRGVAKQG